MPRPLRAVLDLGGNIGLFGVYVMGRWPGASVRSFEPDPTNLPILNRVIAANALGGRWSVANVAVANHSGRTAVCGWPVRRVTTRRGGRAGGAGASLGTLGGRRDDHGPHGRSVRARSRCGPHQDRHRGRRVVDPHRSAPGQTCEPMSSCSSGTRAGAPSQIPARPPFGFCARRDTADWRSPRTSTTTGVFCGPGGRARARDLA